MTRTQKRSNSGERVILSWILAFTLVLSNGLPVMADDPRTTRVTITSTDPTSTQEQINNLIGDGDTTYTANIATTTTDAQGGAIWIDSTANLQGSVLPSFNTSYATSSSDDAEGGAIWNSGTITGSSTTAAIIGNFTGNYAISQAVGTSTQGYHAYGGAIYNTGTIGGINVVGIKGAQFTSNFVKTTESGGSHTDYNNLAYGGAIYNATSHTIYGIEDSNFTDNKAIQAKAQAAPGGGAIFNGGTITHIINSSFAQNALVYASETSVRTGGGAILNAGTIGSETTVGITNSSFIGNDAGNYAMGGGAILNYNESDSARIYGIENSSFIGNQAKVGGAINNKGCTIGSVEITGIKDSQFIGNHSKISGGAIINDNGRIYGIQNSTFIGNYVESTDDGVTVVGGAILNQYMIDGGITDSDFINNHVVTTGADSVARGGAICHTSTFLPLTINARNRDVTFRGNYVKAHDMTQAKGSAIFCCADTPVVLNVAPSRKIIFYDDQTIEGIVMRNPDFGIHVGYYVNIEGGGTVEFLQESTPTFKEGSGIYDAGQVTVSGGTTLVISNLTSMVLTLNDGTIDFTGDAEAKAYSFVEGNDNGFGTTTPSINLKGVGGCLKLDVDLAGGEMDSINATNSGTASIDPTAKLHVTSLALQKDSAQDVTPITFTADTNLKGVTQYDGAEELASHANKYKVRYDNTTGEFIFTKSGVSNTTEAMGDGVNVMNFVWLETVNNLQKRLGDLRGGEASDMAWARFQRSNDDYDGARKFNVSGNMYQVGYDFSLKNQVASRGYFGLSLEAFDGTQSYAIGGGDVKSMSLGAYYTKIYDSGHYFDFILRYGRLENDSTSYDATAGLSGILTKLDYAMNSVTLSG